MVMVFEKRSWDERFREGRYATDPDPPAVLRQYVEYFPDGRALDVATGTGRLSVFLAGAGYEVDAIEQSEEGLAIARRRARERDLAVNWIQADAIDFPYPEDRYDVITVRSFRILERLTDVKDALKPGGVLFYQDHVRTSEPMTAGPRGDRYRVGVNELLRSCLDLTVLHYKEFTAEKEGSGLDAYSQVIARKTAGSEQPLPRRRLYQP